MSKKIIIAGGGTGGHIFPAVAIANALKRAEPTMEILFVGAHGKMEMEKVPKEGFKIVGLDIAGMNRSNMLKNITLPIKLLKSLMAAKNIIKDFKPDVCLGVGGYASFPILSAAQKMGIPTVIQEQNSYAGKSNKILGKKAKKVFTAYENMQSFFTNAAVEQLGNPVRKVIEEMAVEKNEAYSFFGLDSHKKTLFVFGGSLGARSINQALKTQLDAIVETGAQIIWQTGKDFYQEAVQAAEKYQGQVKVYDFLREMEQAYTVADVIVSRAGALSIAELCIVGKPVIFVPYPHASEDHQTHNAMALVNKNAAQIITDSEVNEKLGKQVLNLMADEHAQQTLINNIIALAVKNADDRIANQILEIIK